MLENLPIAGPVAREMLREVPAGERAGIADGGGGEILRGAAAAVLGIQAGEVGELKIKVVLNQTTCDLLWAKSDPDRWNPAGSDLESGEAIVELDESVVTQAIDLFDEPTFDDAVQRLVHSE